MVGRACACALSIALLLGCGASAPRVRAGGPACDGTTGSQSQSRADPATFAEVPAARVRRIVVTGARTVPEVFVREAIELAVGDPLEASAIAADVRRVFALEVFEDVQVRATAEGEVRFHVVERPLVRRVALRGAAADVPTAARLARVHGEVYRPSRLSRVAALIAAEHERSGYPAARVEARSRRAAPDRVDVCFVVEPGRRHEIARLILVGASAVPARELRELIRTFGGRVNVAGGLFRADLLEEDAQRMLALYHERGHVDARIEPARPSFGRDGLVVRLRVHEGAPYRLGEVVVTGDLVAAPHEYDRAVALEPGRTFARSELLAAIERVAALERERGRSRPVTPRPQIDRARHVVDVELVVGHPIEPDVDAADGSAPGHDPAFDVGELRLDLSGLELPAEPGP